jgi:hypothetical protein
MTTSRRFLLIALLPVLVSCITTYRDFPTAMIGRAPTAKPYGTLYYHVKPFPVVNAGGQAALDIIFRERTPFAKTRSVDDPPSQGTFCVVEVEWRPPSLPAVAFGYLSISTLTLLPAWSTHEGYIVHYRVFVNGEEKDSFNYQITRKFGLWMGLLPLVWVNLFTHSEEDAFEATAYQFFRDAAPTFAKLAAR